MVRFERITEVYKRLLLDNFLDILGKIRIHDFSKNKTYGIVFQIVGKIHTKLGFRNWDPPPPPQKKNTHTHTD